MQDERKQLYSIYLYTTCESGSTQLRLYSTKLHHEYKSPCLSAKAKRDIKCDDLEILIEIQYRIDKWEKKIYVTLIILGGLGAAFVGYPKDI